MQFYFLLKNEEDAEKLIRILWNRVPELTIQQEKELRKLGIFRVNVVILVFEGSRVIFFLVMI